ncbi:MAG: hypothetical protein OQL19_04650 [Gammaproteobacteria bacterium]|nr:hypothetical protein [Gammaproteobacteria bacterium]
MIITIHHKKQQGVSLVGAIFIMVALAAVGIAMVTLNSTTTTTSALNVQQSRAYFSAISGSEWAIARIAANDNNYATNNDSCSGVDGQLFVVDQFDWRFTCSSTCNSAASCCHSLADCQLSPRVSEVTVTASDGGIGETYRVSRTIQVTVSYDGS